MPSDQGPIYKANFVGREEEYKDRSHHRGTLATRLVVTDKKGCHAGCS